VDWPRRPPGWSDEHLIAAEDTGSRGGVRRPYARAMDFDSALEHLGFTPAQDRSARGTRAYSATLNRYLTTWVHAYDDGTALFTWEFAVTDYLDSKGIQLGSSESLNLFMFPKQDQRGPRTGEWLAEAMSRVEQQLASIDFADPEG